MSAAPAVRRFLVAFSRSDRASRVRRSFRGGRMLTVLLLTVAAVSVLDEPARADGIDWTLREEPEANVWTSVAHGDGVWMAVAQSGENRVMRSMDRGATWEPLAAAAANSWRSVAYGDDVWIAVSNSGTSATQVMRSEDGGDTWQSVAAADARAWSSVAYGGNGVWVAVATSGTSRVMRSVDHGETWVAVPASAATANQWSSVAYGNGVLVAVSTDDAAESTGTNRVMRSVDQGETWVAVPASAANQWRSVAYGDGVWVAISSDDAAESTGTNRVMRSTNGGQSWEPVAAAKANQWYSVAYGDGVWVAVAYFTGEVMRSTDGGVSWTLVPTASAGDSQQWGSVAYGDGVWVAVAATGNDLPRVRTSQAPVLTVVTQPSETVTSGDMLDRQPLVTLVGPGGDSPPRAGVTVTVSISSGDGVLGRTMTAVTAADGVAQFSDLSITGPTGAHVLTFSAPGALPVTSDAIQVIQVTLEPEVEQRAVAGGPTLACTPRLLQVGATVSCTITGGEQGADILWRATYNPVIDEAGVTLDDAGLGEFSFVVPAAALGQELTIELVEWLAPISLGVVGGPVPSSVPSGGGPVPVWSLVMLALAGVLVLRRGMRVEA